jgi:hypothetical protein
MKFKLDVSDQFMPEGKCPMIYHFRTEQKYYKHCSITGTSCVGDLDNQPLNCPITEIEE